jgi:hypothetical protein
MACVNLAVPGGVNEVLLCQYVASVQSAPGDSGGPVSELTGSPTAGDVRLSGVVWGAGVDSPITAFSSITMIQNDLGTLQVCATGFNC